MSIFDIVVNISGGLKVTLTLTILSAILALILAFVAGLGRLSKFKIVRFLSGVYVEVVRGTSLLVQLFWLYFALPMLGLRLSAMTAGVLAIGLNSGAYGSEVVRSSIISIPVGQSEAGIALNMTPTQRRWRIIMPQAIVRMLPAFGNQLIELLKGTALVSLITLGDLTYQSNVLNTSTLETTKIYIALLIMYYIVAWPLTKGVRWLEQKLTVGRY